jgi:hypothetical protein
MRLISFTPSATSPRTSATTLSMERRAMPAAHLRNDAKAAGMIAPLGDLGEGGVRGVRRIRGVSQSGM